MLENLHEDLVETIIAMIPFPCIFKARGLSKPWRARFKPISSLDSKEEKLLATSFQNKVARSSPNWQIIHPFFTSNGNLLNGSCGDSLNSRSDCCGSSQSLECPSGSGCGIKFTGCDHVSQKWGPLPSLSFLPGHALPSILSSRHFEPRFEGAILYWSTGDRDVGRSGGRHSCGEGLFVANLLTREWKQLPPLRVSCPGSERRCLKLVCHKSLGTYKMIVVCQNVEYLTDRCCVHIFDSVAETWSCQACSFRSGREYKINHRTSAVVNGVLYMVPGGTTFGGQQFYPWDVLLAFNVERGTLEEIDLVDTDVGGALRSRTVIHMIFNLEVRLLVTCGDNLFMVVLEDWAIIANILKIDLESRRFSVVSKCNLATSKLDEIRIPLSEVHSVFYHAAGPFGVVLVYNKSNDECSFFSFPSNFSDYDGWIKLPFRPGLNPFMAV